MRYFNNGGTTSDPAGQIAGTEESLSTWAAPYVTDMLAKGKALADQPYTAYTGPLTAGQSGYKPKLSKVLQGLLCLPRRWGLTTLRHLLLAPLLNSI